MALLTWIGEVPDRAARAWGRRAALIFKDRRYSYADISKSVDSLASLLLGLEILPGERVAILMENRPEYLYAYFAIPKMGAIAVPLNSFLAAVELNEVLRDSGAAVLITSADALQRLEPALEGLVELRHLVICGAMPAAAPAPADLRVKRLSGAPPRAARASRAASERFVPPADPDATAVIIYTSGTTGTPRGVMLSHRNLLSNAEACIEAVGVTPRDRILLFLPMFHSFTEMVCMLAPMVAGMSIVLCGKLDKAEIKRAIVRHRPTLFPGVPAVFAAMSHVRIGFLSRWLNPVRIYISGGAPLSLDTLRAFETRYRRPLCEGYGLSEASPVVTLNPPAGPRKPGSVGLPLPGVQIRIVDAQGCDVTKGETGELLVSASSVMKGYDRRPEETAAALAGGWLHTGDLARVDSDGYIFIMGRIKEMLIYRGMNVYPREIEEVLEELPGVKEAAVIGLPEQTRGEVPYAFVVPRDGEILTEADLKRACMEKLARYKVPRGFRIVTELPRNPAGKVLRKALLEEASLHPSG